MKKINLTLILLAALPVAMTARRLDIYTDVRQSSKLQSNTVPVSSTVTTPVQKTVTTTGIKPDSIVSTEYWDIDSYNRRNRTTAAQQTQTTVSTSATEQPITANSQAIDLIRNNSYLEGYNDALYDYSTDFLYTSRFTRFHSFTYAMNYYTDLEYYYDLRFRPWRLSFTIYDPFFYDPFFYDPWYYDPYYHSSYHYTYSWRYGYIPPHHYGYAPGRHEPPHGGNRPLHKFDRYISEFPRNPQRPNNPNRTAAPQQNRPQQPRQPETGIVSRGQNVNTVGTPIQQATVVRVVPNNSNTRTSTQNPNRTQQQSTNQTQTVRSVTTTTTNSTTRTATPAPHTTISVGGGGNTGGAYTTGGGGGGGFNAGRSR